MQKLLELKQVLELAISSISTYEAKPSKAQSKRVRTTLGAVKNLITPARASLILLDKSK